MKQVLCARCKKRPAMFFVTKVEGDKTTQEGLCIKCALEMNIGPVKQIMQSMGISEDELDDVSEQFEAMFGEDGGFEPGGAGTMPFLQNFAAKGELVVQPGLRLLFQPPQEKVGVPPAEENIGDDLLDRGVILGLRTGQKKVLVYDEAADGLDALRRKGLAA